MDIGIKEVKYMIESLESNGEISIKEEKYLKVAKLCMQLAAESVGMDGFVEEMLAIAWQGGSADGSDIQEIALKHGLIRQEVYCADKHENCVYDPGNFDDGYAVYFRTETTSIDRIVAGVKADGVEMFSLMFAEEAIKDNNITTGWKARASRAASEYAELLREGADK